MTCTEYNALLNCALAAMHEEKEAALADFLYHNISDEVYEERCYAASQAFLIEGQSLSTQLLETITKEKQG